MCDSDHLLQLLKRDYVECVLISVLRNVFHALFLQKRNLRTNIVLVAFPLFLCLLLVLIQTIVNSELNKAKNKCGCTCIDTNGDGKCETVCGIEHSTLDQVGTCPIPSPPRWPALLQVPRPEYRAVRTDFTPFTNLPSESCRSTGSCPATILVTGGNRSLGESMTLSLSLSYFFLYSVSHGRILEF